MLTDDEISINGVEKWRISALRIMLVVGYCLYSAIAIHSCLSAANTNIYYLIPITAGFYILATVQLSLSSKYFHLSAYLLLFNISAAAICINLLVKVPLLAMLGPVFIFSLPLAAFVLLGAKVGFICMLINVVPFIALLNGFQLSAFTSEHILLEYSDAYIFSIIFLFFNICAPLGVARASLAAKRLNKKITGQNTYLKTQNDLYKTLFIEASTAKILVNAAGYIQQINAAAEQLLDFNLLANSAPVNISTLFTTVDKDTSEAIINRTVGIKMKTFKITRSAKLTQDYYILTVQDITAKSLLHKTLAAQTKLNRQQHLNQANGLPNRQWLESKIKKRLTPSLSEVCLISIELSNAQFIEQKFGFQFLGSLVQKVAEYWQTKMTLQSDLASLNHINITIASEMNYSEAHSLISKFITLLPSTVIIRQQKLPLAVKVGVAFSHDAEQDIDQLINNVHYAVSSGKSLINFHENASLERFIEHNEINILLNEAIMNSELNIVYQPKVKGDGNVIGLEALLRWHSPVIGDVSPAIFIPIAEKSGLVPLITQWLITHICEQIAQWKKSNIELVPVAINISGIDLDQEFFHEYLVNALVEKKIEPHLIELELTESASSVDLTKAQATLKYLSNWGFCVTLDDFGIGYSGLSKLISFPVKKVKIDRQFVKDIHKDEQKTKIVEAMIAMCKVFNIDILAEGVETLDEVDTLLRLGCNNFQGFVFAKPLCTIEVTKVLVLKNVLAFNQSKSPIGRSENS